MAKKPDNLDPATKKSIDDATNATKDAFRDLADSFSAGMKKLQQGKRELRQTISEINRESRASDAKIAELEKRSKVAAAKANQSQKLLEAASKAAESSNERATKSLNESFRAMFKKQASSGPPMPPTPPQITPVSFPKSNKIASLSSLAGGVHQDAAFKSLPKFQKDIEKTGKSFHELTDAVLKDMPQANDEFEKATKIQKKLNHEISDATKAMREEVAETQNESKVMGALSNVVGSVAAGAWAAFKKILTANFDYMNTYVLPTLSSVRKEFGDMGKSTDELSGRALAMGNHFRELGLDFTEGVKSVTDFAAALRTVNLTKDQEQLGAKLSTYIGLGGKQAGELAQAFMTADGNLKHLDSSMAGAIGQAKEYHVPVNQIRKDFGENIDVLQRFGIANVQQFNKSIAKANSYGLSIKQVNAVFGRALDSFEGTSDAAAKLNTVFGTNINSLKLMQETDPTKRMEMIRKELNLQGKDWQKLSVFERNAITDTLHIDNQQAALAFSNDKVRKSLQAQAAQKEKDAKTNEKWDHSISNLKTTLLNWEFELEKLARTVSNIVAKFFGFNGGLEGTAEVADTVKNAMHALDKYLDIFYQNMDKSGTGGQQILDFLRDFSAGLRDSKDLLHEVLEAVKAWNNFHIKDVPINAMLGTVGAVTDALTSATKGKVTDVQTESGERIDALRAKMKAQSAEPEMTQAQKAMNDKKSVPSAGIDAETGLPKYMLAPINVQFGPDTLLRIITKTAVQSG